MGGGTFGYLCTCPRRPEVLGPLEGELQATEVTQGWEMNSGPLKEQQRKTRALND